jgi:hypothetical protein
VRSRCILLAAVIAVAGGGSVAAENAPPDAGTLLFEEPQLETTRPGDVLNYSYTRKTSDDSKFGPSFSDHIRLTIEKGDKAESRTVEVQLFTGANHRAAGPFPDMMGNPLLSLFLENHIGMLSTQFHANPRYLKNAIRAGLRDKATVEAGRVDVGGRSEPGWHVRLMPFKDDPNKDHMLGLDTMTYEFAVTKEVPGEIAEIHITAAGGQGARLLDERVVYDAKAD